MGDERWPTRENIVRAMRDLVAGAQPGDHYVFHFSGHGGQVKNEDGTEKSGFDDVIWPVDIELRDDDDFENYIKDDEIHDILVEHVPPGAHFMMVFDCCHSGTMADLPNDSEDTRPPSPSSASSGTMFPPSAVKNIRVRGTHDVSGTDGTERKVKQAKFSAPLPPQETVIDDEQPTSADVTSWGACLDDQITLGGRSGGIFIKAFANALRKNPMETYEQLLRTVTRELAKITASVNFHNHEDYDPPTPELESSMPMDQVYDRPIDI
ncbi:peptidase C14 [Laetiporus sulphureus 93-53]|uniref:Peptidase C14 n=1 Tax=Laetiporus sulphureus 93-53 TaxID=1314785 RepID=A0A165DBB2_9APHY|nr:peptidase C14 [Laetiporus sulphureus 93-53]KZT04477.1 peptidase C14 [Laetiporus sulphureus 93-53]